MCGVCERIRMIREGTNPYFVKELEKMKQQLLKELDMLLWKPER